MLSSILQVEDSKAFDVALLRLLHGSVGRMATDYGEYHLEVTLVSKRFHKGAGCRFTRRGVGPTGGVANAVETEQILKVYKNPPGLKDKKKAMNCIEEASVVVTRGSVPIYWQQKIMPQCGCLPMRMPPIEVSAGEEDCSLACQEHLQELTTSYSACTVLDLLRQGQGDMESELSSRFKASMGRIPETTATSEEKPMKPRYVSWDFHAKCGHFGFDRVQELITELKEDISFFGYFSKEKVLTQKGIFRVNCADSLDRTNVVQAALCETSLNDQLRGCKVFGDNMGGSIDGSATLKSMFRELWADHGDVTALQYAGTGALKSDYTRTGVRTYGGACDDLYKAIDRAYQDNYVNPQKQIVVDDILRAGNR